MSESAYPSNVPSDDTAATPGSPNPSGPTGAGAGFEPEARRPSLIDAELEREIAEAMNSMSSSEMELLTGQAHGGGGRDQEGVLTGRIVGVHGDDVFIDVGGRAEGICPLEQFDSVPQVGGTVEVTIERIDPETGTQILSRKGAILAASWASLRRGAIVEGRVTGMNKGGLELDLNGIRAFMPASQCDVHRMRDVSVLIGERLVCEVTEVDRRDENVLVSRRRLQEREIAESRDRLMTELAEGQIRTGIVGNVTDFGAFVDLGGVDGLIHISNLSHAHVEKTGDVVQPGQRVEVKVLKINRETGKIALGLKQAQADPWATVLEKYPVGTHLHARVIRMADFGAFVEIEPGVDALIPISEMSWIKRVRHPSEILSEGQVVSASVLKVDVEKRRISLSLKQLETDPWAGVDAEFPANSVVLGRVARTTDFGAFVELRAGVEGLVHISEMSDSHVRRASDVAKPGDEVKVKILGVDMEARKISLSMKQASEAYAGAPGESGGVADAKKDKKRKKPLRGGLSTDNGWFIG
jgi:small subunit ribosomal protein S1